MASITYLHSGDTISVTSSQEYVFYITAQSVSSQDEEAGFLIGIPDADIQKVIIPQYGLPAKMKEVRIEFEQPYGAIRVSKNSADNGAMLSGATFELMDASGAVVATQTTGRGRHSAHLIISRLVVIPCGKLARRRVTKVAVNPSQTVTVAAGATSDVRFANDRINGKIRIVKRDALTKEALAGAVFTVTCLSAAEGGGTVGEVVATLTTGAGRYGGNRMAAMGQISDCRNRRSRTLCRWRFCNRNRLHGGRKNLYRRSGKRADKGLYPRGENRCAGRCADCRRSV